MSNTAIYLAIGYLLSVGISASIITSVLKQSYTKSQVSKIKGRFAFACVVLVPGLNLHIALSLWVMRLAERAQQKSENKPGPLKDLVEGEHVYYWILEHATRVPAHHLSMFSGKTVECIQDSEFGNLKVGERYTLLSDAFKTETQSKTGLCRIYWAKANVRGLEKYIDLKHVRLVVK
jgi:hypothetical protein